jgi:hypothetical protein
VPGSDGKKVPRRRQLHCSSVSKAEAPAVQWGRGGGSRGGQQQLVDQGERGGLGCFLKRRRMLERRRRGRRMN